MDKEDFKKVTAEGIIIAKIKEEIFNVITKFNPPYYMHQEEIIHMINSIPLYEFKRLAQLSSNRLLYNNGYNDKIRRIVNRILEDFNGTSNFLNF